MKKALLILSLFISATLAYGQVSIPDFENNVVDKSHPFDDVYKNYQLIIATGGSSSEFGSSRIYNVYLLQNGHWRRAIYTESKENIPKGLRVPIKEIATTDSTANALYKKLIDYGLFTIVDDIKLPPCDTKYEIHHPSENSLWIITPEKVRHLYYNNLFIQSCQKDESRRKAWKIVLDLGESS